MNKRLLLIIGGLVALAVVGVVVFLVIRGQSQPEAPVPTIVPQTQAPLKITVSSTPGILNASSSANLDIFLNTNGTKIDGFQFIATLDGDGHPVVTDADPGTPAVQIQSAAVTGMNTVTNSVATEGTAQVIRYAMITQTASQPFSSSTPIKVATITFVPGAPGSVDRKSVV